MNRALASHTARSIPECFLFTRGEGRELLGEWHHARLRRSEQGLFVGLVLLALTLSGLLIARIELVPRCQIELLLIALGDLLCRRGYCDSFPVGCDTSDLLLLG